MSRQVGFARWHAEFDERNEERWCKSRYKNVYLALAYNRTN